MKGHKILIALLLASCAGCATLYQKEGVFTNGYSDFRKAEDHFVVTFRANEHTLEEDVLRFALVRAAELTIEHGFHYFSVLNQTGQGLQYPSLRLEIQCYHSEPTDRESIDAKDALENYL